MKIIIAILMLLLGVIGMNAQTFTVKGVVVDENGEIVIGATLAEKNTKTFAISDLSGQFVITLPLAAKELEVSYLGYNVKKVPVNKGMAATSLRIQLEPSNIALDEVVVIGYGTAKRSDLTGAVTSVKSEGIDDRSNENVLGTLQGQLAGVEITNMSGAPGGEFEVHIRGTASINAGDQPLYVVDGIPVDDLSGLNPSDIETIDVLKDASSSAIYGSRGANGVVLIKTKTPVKNDRVNVTFNASFAVQQVEHVLDLMSPTEWIEWRTNYNNKTYVDTYGYLGATASDDYQTRLSFTGGSIRTTMVNDPRWAMPGYGGLALIDWQDEVFRTAPKQTYDLSVAGSTAKTNYRMSLGYVNQEGTAINTSYDRLSARLNVQSAIHDRVTIGMMLAATNSVNKGVNPAVLSQVPVAEPEAGVYTASEPYPNYNWAQSSVSPVAIQEQSSRTYEDFRLQSTAFVRADLCEGLRAEVTGNYNFRTTQLRQFTPSSISSRWATGDGYYAVGTRQDNRSHSYLLQGVLNYDNHWGAHTVSAMAGTSLESAKSYSSRLRATHFPDNNLEVFDMSDVDITQATASEGYDVRMLSFFGRVQYDYDSRYMLTASLRGDGSSRFGRNNRWGRFPAMSAAWRISQERFWPENKWASSLKLRMSWGANGNNSIRDGVAMGLMSHTNYSFGGSLINGYSPSSPEIADLTWEKAYSWNWGVDVAFFNNRINLSVDYYRKTTKDLLYQVTVPGVSGYETMWSNVGEVFNEGVELEIRSVNIKNKKFSWNTNFSFAYNRNEVVSLGENNETVFLSGNSNTTNLQVLMVGEPMRSFYMYDAVGVYQYQNDLLRYPVMTGTQLGDVRYRDVNDDGRINDADRTLVGKPNPDVVLGMTNRLSWRKWDLSISCSAQYGGYLYSVIPGRYIDNAGMHISQNMFRWWKNMWISEEQPGDGRTPAIDSTTGELRDTRWLYKTDFFRIKNITLGYTFNFRKKFIRGIRMYSSVENVWIWDEYDGGYSPENKGNNIYPQARVYTLGVNVKF